MNTSTSTRTRIFAAGAIFAFTPFAVPAASASTYVPGGDSPTTAEQFDVAEFVARAKAQMAHDRATRPTTDSGTRYALTTTGQDAGERVAQAKSRAPHNRGR